MSRFFLALFLVFSSGSVFAQGKIKADVQNFRAEPNQGGRRMVVKGESAASAGNDLWKLIKPHVETFRPDNSPDVIIDAAECFFQQGGNNDVWSEKELQMRTADDRLAIKGVGFQWKGDQSQLTISNRVEATIRRQAILQTSDSTNRASGNIEVTSDRLVYSAELVIFTGHVHVKDSQGEIFSDTLRVRFDQTNAPQEIEAIDNVLLTQGETKARGKRALYTRANGLLRLFENTKWQMGDREGESELLILDRTNNTFRAENKVLMSFPAALLSTNTTAEAKAGNTNRITIRADTFDYAPSNRLTHGAIAIYNGNVHAAEPEVQLDCELLTIYFGASNRLARAVADRAVRIARPDTSVRGDKAVFENDEVTVTGAPVWTHQDRGGTSDFLVFNPRTREIRAREVRMEIPNVTGTNTLFGGNAPKEKSTNIMVITASYFTNVNNVATFSEKVRATDPRGQIDANSIAVHFNSTNRIERIVASGDVILTEDKLQAIGKEADYDLSTETIRLTGKPRLFTEGREIIAREFLVDRKANQFIPLAPYWAKLVRVSSSPTNRTNSSK